MTQLGFADAARRGLLKPFSKTAKNGQQMSLSLARLNFRLRPVGNGAANLNR
jgi:hypothetical protein